MPPANLHQLGIHRKVGLGEKAFHWKFDKTDETNFSVKSLNDLAATLEDQCKWQKEIYPLPLQENTLSVSVRVLSDCKKAAADLESALRVIISSFVTLPASPFSYSSPP